MSAFKFLGISGSLRKASYNSGALRAAEELAGPEASFEFAELGDIPLYNDDVKQKSIPAAVLTLCEMISVADAVLISTPEYNYSIPGVLKNAIDWISRVPNQPFAGKPVGIIGASPGILGTARAQYELRKVMASLSAHVLNSPEIMIGAAGSRFDAEGKLIDEQTKKFLKAHVEALQAWALRLRR